MLSWRRPLLSIRPPLLTRDEAAVVDRTAAAVDDLRVAVRRRNRFRFAGRSAVRDAGMSGR
ncbi:MAG: hypothetical protein ABEH58_00740, partial [Haloplanus sp.]